MASIVVGQPIIYPSVVDAHMATTTELDVEGVRVDRWLTDADGVTRYACSTEVNQRVVVSLHRYTDFVHLHAALGRRSTFPVPKELFMTAASRDQRAKALQTIVRQLSCTAAAAAGASAVVHVGSAVQDELRGDLLGGLGGHSSWVFGGCGRPADCNATRQITIIDSCR